MSPFGGKWTEEQKAAASRAYWAKRGLPPPEGKIGAGDPAPSAPSKPRPDPPPPQTRTVKSIEEIMRDLSDLLDSGDGAQKTQAARLLLTAQQSSSVTLPEPRSEREVIDRLARLMLSWGPETTKKAMHAAFPSYNAKKAPPKYDHPDVDWKTHKLPRQLRHLKAAFPEYDWPHVPNGYPSLKGALARMLWCQDEYKRMTLEKMNREAQEAHARERESEAAGTEEVRPGDRLVGEADSGGAVDPRPEDGSGQQRETQSGPDRPTPTQV